MFLDEHRVVSDGVAVECVYTEVRFGMATSKSRRPGRWTVADYVVNGFAMITLDPAPRMRLLRARLRKRNYYAEVRKELFGD